MIGYKHSKFNRFLPYIPNHCLSVIRVTRYGYSSVKLYKSIPVPPISVHATDESEILIVYVNRCYQKIILYNIWGSILNGNSNVVVHRVKSTMENKNNTMMAIENVAPWVK